MTRINVIDPKELTTKHLVAEYRELPRIFALSYAAQQRGESPNNPLNPKEYTLGKGHVRFFYNKISFLKKRFASLVHEMHCRGYHTSFTEPPFYNHASDWSEDWEPTEAAIQINKKRIADKLSKK